MPDRTLRLRPWQKRALDRFLEDQSSDGGIDFLAVATPGAGKTTFALTAARLTLPRLNGRVVVVAPTRHLKVQWARAAERFGLHLETDWSPADRLPADFHGLVTTYQQVGSSPDALASIAYEGFIILDEVHHAGQELTWGDGIRTAFVAAAQRLSLSGTPFRSDSKPIPFVKYVDGQAAPDIEYGYGRALSDGQVVRPVYFPRFGGQMEWTTPEGDEVAASFDDPLARAAANQRLRAALSLEGDWLSTVVGHANAQLRKLREVDRDAAGLIIAKDQQHAQGIVRMLRNQFGTDAELAVSDDAKASNRIADFAASNRPWIVAVRMISEGVDIPRLRVAVYATTTTTELFFRQAVGRIVRYTPSDRPQRAYMFVPDDPRLRHWGDTIAQSRRHDLKKSPAEEDEAQPVEVDERSEQTDEQMSLFAVHSATASAVTASIFDETSDEQSAVPAGQGSDTSSDGEHLIIRLDELPPAQVSSGVLKVDRAERERLRRMNTDLARQLAEITHRPHSVVHAELNRRSGIAKVAEASAAQLDRRVRAAEEWLREEERRRRFAKFV